MEETGFLQALLEDSADETSRLVFADWLDERGDPRGELLRVQLELDRWVPDLERRMALQQREQQLLAAWLASWPTLLRQRCRDWRVEAGLATVTMDARSFVVKRFATQAETCLRQAWVRGLRLQQTTAQVDALARAPHLAAVTSLDLSSNGLDDAALQELLASPYLGGLRELDLSNNALSDRTLPLLVQAPWFRRLTALSLRNNALTCRGARVLLDATPGTALRRLSLQGNDLDANEVQGLVPWLEHQDKERRLVGLPVGQGNSLGMEFRLIPAGTFLMGSPIGEAERLGDEGPLHEVTLTRPYYLGIFTVTQQQYAAVMRSNPSGFSRANGGGSAHPVEQLTWADAVTFCRLLSDLPDEKAAGRVYRLPTEAEWEHACRAGDTRTLPFCFGQTLTTAQANFNGTLPYGESLRGPYLGRTAPVGSYPPNGWGLYDMHGNVWEWCSDWFHEDYYGRSSRTDPHGPRKKPGRYRTLRGGAYFDYARHCRCAIRGRNEPEAHHDGLGFRVLLEIG
jgi:uncharacterized protein (TIGR02996 family)